VSFFFFQAEDGIRDFHVTGVQTCALPISPTHCHACRGARAMPRFDRLLITGAAGNLGGELRRGLAPLARVRRLTDRAEMGPAGEIGRASCREGVETPGVAVARRNTEDRDR